MMKRRFLALLLYLILNSTYSYSQIVQLSQNNLSFTLHYNTIDDQEAQRINIWLHAGRLDIIDFFHNDFQQTFDVYLHCNRDSLDKQWQQEWNMPSLKSECWMVASGVAYRLDILSPRVWETQACEHNVLDTSATKKLILHELIHVYHGQLNPSPTFENTNNLDWYIEGIAVYASGQLDIKRLKEIQELFQNGGGPEMLSDIWKGKNRYGLAGSIVKYLDDIYGREVLIDLLTFTEAGEVLNYLGISEIELIKSWTNNMKQ